MPSHVAVGLGLTIFTFGVYTFKYTKSVREDLDRHQREIEFLHERISKYDGIKTMEAKSSSIEITH